MGGKAPKIKTSPMEKFQVEQLRGMEQLFGPIRQWMTGQGMSSLMGGRNPFSQAPNPQAERATLDHIDTLRGLQGGYNQAYGNLGGLGMEMLQDARFGRGGGQTMPNAPDLDAFMGGSNQLIGPLLNARNQIIGGALPQALEAFNPHLDTATMQALAGQGQQARDAATEKSPMRGGQLASALNDIGSQEAMAKAALTYQAGQEARQNALQTLGPQAMGPQLMNTMSGQIAPQLDIYKTQAGLYDAAQNRSGSLGLASMPWVREGQLGPLDTTRDLSSDVMGLISALYGGAEDQGVTRALSLLGGSAFPNAGQMMSGGNALSALAAQRQAANAQAKGSKKGDIGGGLGSLAGTAMLAFT